jgi:hypothetical protein
MFKDLQKSIKYISIPSNLPTIIIGVSVSPTCILGLAGIIPEKRHFQPLVDAREFFLSPTRLKRLEIYAKTLSR